MATSNTAAVGPDERWWDSIEEQPAPAPIDRTGWVPDDNLYYDDDDELPAATGCSGDDQEHEVPLNEQEDASASQEGDDTQDSDLNSGLEDNVPVQGLMGHTQDAVAVDIAISHGDEGTEFLEELYDAVRGQDLEGDEQDASLSEVWSEVFADTSTYDDLAHLLGQESDSGAGGEDDEPVRAHSTPHSRAASIDDSGYGTSLSGIEPSIAEIDNDGTCDSDLGEELQQVGTAVTTAGEGNGTFLPDNTGVSASAGVQTAQRETRASKKRKRGYKTIADFCAELRPFSEEHPEFTQLRDLVDQHSNNQMRVSEQDLEQCLTKNGLRAHRGFVRRRHVRLNDIARRNDRKGLSTDPEQNHKNAVKNKGGIWLRIIFDENAAANGAERFLANPESSNYMSSEQGGVITKHRPAYVVDLADNDVPRAFAMFTFNGTGLTTVHPSKHYLFVEVVHRSDLSPHHDPANVVVVDGAKLLATDCKTYICVEPVPFAWNQPMYEYKREETEDGQDDGDAETAQYLTDTGKDVLTVKYRVITDKVFKGLAVRTDPPQITGASIPGAPRTFQESEGAQLRPAPSDTQTSSGTPGGNSGDFHYQHVQTNPPAKPNRGAVTGLMSGMDQFGIHSGPVSGAGNQVGTDPHYDRSLSGPQKRQRLENGGYQETGGTQRHEGTQRNGGAQRNGGGQRHGAKQRHGGGQKNVGGQGYGGVQKNRRGQGNGAWQAKRKTL